MSERQQLFPPPPSHPTRSRNASPSVSANDLLRRIPPPPLPARPSYPVPESARATAPGAPITPPPEHLPGSMDDVDGTILEDNQSLSDAQTIHEEELTEAQLREVYDEEEINRFLYLFSTKSVYQRVQHPQPLSLRLNPKVDLTLEISKSQTASVMTKMETGLNPPTQAQHLKQKITLDLNWGTDSRHG
ncbi:hypothetical protein PHLGIDRAFT_395308 [Phlebiopsis gigantea 11061_1 CR5-6]|uniref:Uncharacterized protein n=1 Tax=Phlebiopsis gigantea (strain 11061_1 CR5-6) TaxID=745531 RepID=A0A0C3SFE3_PHLG1|nr:hypothetical protein PHLGIDRAFT_395308 [Phlebiopsis gigantea 11061_1 CR5-6]